jgi:hypothetical protein
MIGTKRYLSKWTLGGQPNSQLLNHVAVERQPVVLKSRKARKLSK